MTREEATELLEDLDGAIEDNHGRDYDEAFRMAIEALSSDAISRAELFNRLAVIKSPAEANEYKAEVYRTINEM